jgi:tetratricopeptide (TPR) repeat protein
MLTNFRTGRILQALGNVYESQGKLDESFGFHKRALEQFRSTVGHSHHRTADVCHKLAGHYIRIREYETARYLNLPHKRGERLTHSRKLLEQALRIYNGRAQLKQEKARTSFKMGILLQVTGHKEAAVHLQEAWSIYHALIPNNGRTLKDLTDADFDSLVSFWT